VHQGSSGVALAGVLAPVAVSRTEHLLVDDHVDPVLPMPALADPVFDHGHIHRLERLGTQPRARIEGSPAGGPTELAQEVLVLLRQANGS